MEVKKFCPNCGKSNCSSIKMLRNEDDYDYYGKEKSPAPKYLVCNDCGQIFLDDKK